ncbi:nitrite reductase small subunit NirD [Halalkalibacter okhensis]|uniref:Nitrite reductase n=1 Tax=Halalkalibacter okhensis TaxID=333138 RepID=A0A0B0IJV2_9BACI|nr:nitrite reductase small subunit NirD [Halalkalibacter okhensis]KHF39921.1 nitrite reductase [Halalkalibacter okhensis]
MISTGTRINICKYDHLPSMIGQVFVIGHNEMAVFRLSNGNVRAIENKSPHPKGGRLADGLVSGEYVYCPIHDWIISLIDGKVQAPDRGQVKTYPIEVSGEDVYLII